MAKKLAKTKKAVHHLETIENDEVKVCHYRGTIDKIPEALLKDHKKAVAICLLNGAPLQVHFHKKATAELIKQRFMLLTTPGNLQVQTANHKSSLNDAVEFFIIYFNNNFLLDVIPATGNHFSSFRSAISGKKAATLTSTPGLLSGEMKVQLFNFFTKRPKFKILEETFISAKSIELINQMLEEALLYADGRLAVSFKEESLAAKAMQLMSAKNSIHDFTIKHLAEQLKTNETTLKHSFKKTYGTTIYKYSTNTRMSEAQRMLKEGKKVSEVAGLLGYSNVGHFSTAFSRFFRIAPGKVKIY